MSFDLVPPLFVDVRHSRAVFDDESYRLVLPPFDFVQERGADSFHLEPVDLAVDLAAAQPLREDAAFKSNALALF